MDNDIIDNDILNDELIRMVNEHHDLVRSQDRLRLAMEKSVGQENGIPYNIHKRKTGIRVRDCLLFLIVVATIGSAGITIASGVGEKISAIITDKKEYGDIRESEIRRIKELLAANNLSGNEEDISILKGQISDEEVLGFYLFFKQQGYVSGRNETQKILALLGYANYSGNRWDDFLATQAIRAQSGSRAPFYDSEGKITNKIPSIEEWEKYALKNKKDKYDYENNVIAMDNEEGINRGGI